MLLLAFAAISGIGLALFQDLIPGAGLSTGLYMSTRHIGSIVSGPIIALGALPLLGQRGGSSSPAPCSPSWGSHWSTPPAASRQGCSTRTKDTGRRTYRLKRTGGMARDTRPPRDLGHCDRAVAEALRRRASTHSTSEHVPNAMSKRDPRNAGKNWYTSDAYAQLEAKQPRVRAIVGLVPHAHFTPRRLMDEVRRGTG